MSKTENQPSKSGTLYIVPTPIGNLSDITERAISVLSKVNLIAAEDTRHTGRLLTHLSISTKMVSFHDHNEQSKAQFLIEKLESGLNVALVSDAGTPLISDPGYHLVHSCQKRGLSIVPLPGACALITALSASGLPSDRFSFEGFIPTKSKARKQKFAALQQATQTLIFYESTHRILDSLREMLEIFGPNRQVVIARELTKAFETIHGGPLDALIDWMCSDHHQQKGEFVVLVDGYKMPPTTQFPPEITHLLTQLAEELPLKKAAAIIAEVFQLKKNMLYKWGLDNLS